ncbi:hypothetical protein [Methylovulum sp.]|uniref:hypothetical protein n=1 Tax=Methylovulum sp. TaxID=1916980 RepID=UPI0026055C98|nr:hypothetical protein [Methylovulum sp.]MDD5125377.1 hypothetical protein [Methylovulum sp.]
MKIRQLRFSCVWTLNFLDKLEDCELGEEDKYLQCFEKALNRNTNSEWLAPWNHVNGKQWNESLKISYFWKKYLELKDDEQKYEDILIKYGNQAWRHILPLKFNSTLNIIQTNVEHGLRVQHVKFEGFAYPCGIGV